MYYTNRYCSSSQDISICDFTVQYTYIAALLILMIVRIFNNNMNGGMNNRYFTFSSWRSYCLNIINSNLRTVLHLTISLQIFPKNVMQYALLAFQFAFMRLLRYTFQVNRHYSYIQLIVPYSYILYSEFLQQFFINGIYIHKQK